MVTKRLVADLAIITRRLGIDLSNIILELSKRDSSFNFRIK